MPRPWGLFNHLRFPQPDAWSLTVLWDKDHSGPLKSITYNGLVRGVDPEGPFCRLRSAHRRDADAAFNRMEEELRGMGLIEDGDDDISVWGLPLRKVDAASRMISTAMRVYGPDAARRLWEKDKSLPQLRRFSISRMVDTPIDDPHGCLRHLMSSEGRSQSTIGQMLDLGLRDEAAAGALRSHGILVNPGAQKGMVAVADDHPFLRGVFARTQWAGAWKQALIYLEGASRTRRQIIFSRGNSSQPVLVPAETIIRARHGGGLN